MYHNFPLYSGLCLCNAHQWFVRFLLPSSLETVSHLGTLPLVCVLFFRKSTVQASSWLGRDGLLHDCFHRETTTSVVESLCIYLRVKWFACLSCVSLVRNANLISSPSLLRGWENLSNDSPAKVRSQSVTVNYSWDNFRRHYCAWAIWSYQNSYLHIILIGHNLCGNLL